MSTSRFFAFVSIALVICGCTKTVRQRVVEYRPGTVPTTQPVPATAVYSIRFVDSNGKKFGGIASSHVYLHKGEPIGFAFDEEGKLRGIAGTYNIYDFESEKRDAWTLGLSNSDDFGRALRSFVAGQDEGMSVPSFRVVSFYP